MRAAREEIASAEASQRIGETTRYAGAMYAVRLAALVKAAVLARFLGPSHYGVITAFATFLAYGAFLDFGVFHGQNREIPLLRGVGEFAQAKDVAKVARATSLLSGVGAGVILLAVAGLQSGGVLAGDWWFTAALAAAVAMQMISGMLHSLCFAEQRFALQARALGLSAAADVFVSLPAAYFFGVKGVLAVAVVAPAVQWLVLRVGIGRVGSVWDFGMMRSLVLTGLPIAAVWIANTNLVGVDKLVILGALGTERLGLYSIAAVAGTLVTIGPNAISQTITPRMLERFGRDRGTGGSLELTYLAENVSGIAGGAIAGLGIVSAPWLIEWLLPSYAPSVRAAQVLMAASAVFGTIHPAVAYFVGHGRQLEMAVWYFATAAVNVVIDLILVSMGAGIVGVAFGSLISYCMLYVVVQARTARLAGEQTRSASGIQPVVLSATGVLLGSAILAVLTYGGIERSLAGGLVGVVAVLVTMVPFAEFVARRHDTSILAVVSGRSS